MEGECIGGLLAGFASASEEVEREELHFVDVVKFAVGIWFQKASRLCLEGDDGRERYSGRKVNVGLMMALAQEGKND